MVIGYVTYGEGLIGIIQLIVPKTYYMTFVHDLGKTNERHTPLAKNALVAWAGGIAAVAAFYQVFASV